MTRILHLSDTHIDRSLGRLSRESDIGASLAEVVELVQEHKPDLVIHSGDLFHGPHPSIGGLGMAFDFLREVAVTAPIVVVCGNHDSAQLLSILDKALGDRIHLVTQVRSPHAGGILHFPGSGNEVIRLAPLPFVHPNRISTDQIFGESATWTAGYADYITKIENMLADGLRENMDFSRDILLFSAHVHVAGASWSGSEKAVSVSDAYGSTARSIPPVSYAAMGHIHKPQVVPGLTPGRFSGSLIQMDFGEEDESKGVVLVDLKPGRPAEINVIPLTRARQLKRLSGTIEEIAKDARDLTNEIVRITVDTPTHDPQLSSMIADALPQDVTLLEVVEHCRDRQLTVLDAHSFQDSEVETDFVGMFADFLSTQGSLAAPAADVMSAFQRIFEDEDPGEYAHIPELDALAEQAASLDGNA